MKVSLESNVIYMLENHELVITNLGVEDGIYKITGDLAKILHGLIDEDLEVEHSTKDLAQEEKEKVLEFLKDLEDIGLLVIK